MALGALPATAQLSSKGGQITLIARLPETLGMSVNANEDVSSLAAADAHNPAVARSLTVSWSLARGRAQVVTLARVNRSDARVLIALAVPRDVNSFLNGGSDSRSGFGFSKQPRVSNTRLDVVNVTAANRATTNTISLSDSLPPCYEVPQDGYVGTVKIQLEAVP